MKMKNTNLIVISVLAAVLLSGTFISLVAAQEVSPPDPTAAPDHATTSDGTTTDSSDSAITQGDGNDVLYTIQDNSTATNDTRVPSEVPSGEEGTLIATNTGSDNTLPLVAVAAVVAVAVGALGVLFYRMKSKEA
jgi:hypothetical protein